MHVQSLMRDAPDTDVCSRIDGRACACTEAEIPHRSVGRPVMDLEGKRADSDTCQAAAWAGAGGIERFQGDMIARRKREPSARKSVTATPVGVKNAYPSPKSASKMRTLGQKVGSAASPPEIRK